MTIRSWIVVLRTSDNSNAIYVYGPFADFLLATRFAAWVTESVDPAEVRELRDPACEMLTWYEGGQHNYRRPLVSTDSVFCPVFPALLASDCPICSRYEPHEHSSYSIH